MKMYDKMTMVPEGTGELPKSMGRNVGSKTQLFDARKIGVGAIGTEVTHPPQTAYHGK